MAGKYPDVPGDLEVGDEFAVRENFGEVEHVVTGLREHARGRKHGTWVRVGVREGFWLMDPGEPIRIIRRS